MKTKKKLLHLSGDYLTKQRRRPYHMLRLDEAVVEFVIEAELLKVPVSGQEIMRVSCGLANKLQIPERCGPSGSAA